MLASSSSTSSFFLPRITLRTDCLFFAFVLVSFFISPSLQQSSSPSVSNTTEGCPNNCSGNGVCVQGVCYCNLYWGFYGTDDCSFNWTSDPHVYFWNLFCMIFVSLLQVLLLIFDSYQIAHIVRSVRKERKPAITVVSVTLVFLWLGIAFELAAAMVPAWQGDNANVQYLLNALAQTCDLSACYTILLFWIELQQKNNVRLILGVTRLRPLLIVLVILTLVTLVPTAFLSSSSSAINVVNIVYTVFLSIWSILVILISLIWGIKLLRDLRQMYESSRNRNTLIFMRKITLFIFGINACIIINSITNPITTVINTPYAAIFGGLIIEVMQSMAVFFGLLVIQKRSASSSDSRVSTDVNSEGKSSEKEKKVNQQQSESISSS